MIINSGEFLELRRGECNIQDKQLAIKTKTQIYKLYLRMDCETNNNYYHVYVILGKGWNLLLMIFF